jgi:hypothetical protein
MISPEETLSQGRKCSQHLHHLEQVAPELSIALSGRYLGEQIREGILRRRIACTSLQNQGYYFLSAGL